MRNEENGSGGRPALQARYAPRARRLRSDPVNVSRRGVAPRSRDRLRLSLPILALLSIALLLLSRIDHSAARAVRLAIADALAPVLTVAGDMRRGIAGLRDRAAGLLAADTELARLRAENADLKAWRARAEGLEARVKELAEAGHAPLTTDWPFLSARIIADGTGGFTRSALINAGREHGLRVGYPAVNRDGLIGRVVGVGRRSANVLLLTDVTSRVPVLVGRNKVRAVLAGDATALPQLTFLAAGGIEAGDEVVTSGTGGVFPRGLKIGRVADPNGAPRVRLDARLDDVEDVSLLLYDTAAAELIDDPEHVRVKEASRRPLRTPEAGVSLEVPR